MPACYVKVFYDWIEQTAALTDAERGRLINAIVLYARAGEEAELAGNERFVFPLFRSALERDMKLSAKRSENGAMGGRPKASESNEKQTKAKISKQKQTKANESNKDKDKDKDEDEDYNPQTPFEGDETATFGDELRETVKSWLCYKRERHESYTPTGHKLLLSRIASNAKEYGEKAVADIIRDSISSGYKGIVFDRLTRSRQQADRAEKQSEMDRLVAELMAE